MKIGYVRVSKDEQNEHLQTDALTKFGCDRILVEKTSGASTIRPQFDKGLELLRQDDELVVWDIDGTDHPAAEQDNPGIDYAMGIRFRSLTQLLIDTESPSPTTPQGEFIFKLFAILAEHERNRLIQRTWAGLTAAWGRPKGLFQRYQAIAPMVVGRPQYSRHYASVPDSFNGHGV